MTFMLTGKPTVLADQIIIGGDLIAESDADGWIEVELVQGGTYDCIVQGMDDEVQRVQVPSKQAISITHLIWPYIQTLEYDSDTVTVAAGEEETVGVTLTLSSGLETPFEMDNDDKFMARSFASFTVTDPSICALTWSSDDEMIIEGKLAGTTTITAAHNAAAEAERLPAPTRSLATLTVTVTE